MELSGKVQRRRRPPWEDQGYENIRQSARARCGCVHAVRNRRPCRRFPRLRPRQFRRQASQRRAICGDGEGRDCRDAAAQRTEIRDRLRQSAARHHLRRRRREVDPAECRSRRHRAADRRQPPRRPDRARQRPELRAAQRRLCHRIPDRQQFRPDHHERLQRGRREGRRHRHPDAGRHLLRRQQPEVGLHVGLLSGPGRDRQVRQGQGHGRLFRRRRAAAVRRHPEDAHRGPGQRLPVGTCPISTRPSCCASTPRTRSRNCLPRCRTCSAAFPRAFRSC